MWKLLEARKAARGLSILVHGAGAGSVVLGEEAVSFLDPDPHRQVAQQNPDNEQVLRGQGRQCGVSGRAFVGWGSSPQF